MDYKEYPADLADERREKSAKISAISGRKNVNHKSLPQISRIIAEQKRISDHLRNLRDPKRKKQNPFLNRSRNC